MVTNARVAVYLRQSQDRTGEGLGIDRQRTDVKRLCKARGWKIVAEFTDNDVSALSRKPRPAFTEMMKRVDAGEFDVIASRHMDRLLRRLAELESVLERCAATNTAVVTASDGVDTSTDGGRLVARILSSVAQGEVERKSARQRSAIVQAAKAGKWAGGRRAFGYEPDGVTIREPEADLIRQGYADILSGESLGEVARRWTASGFPTTQGNPSWLRGSVKDVLTNPRCAGLRRHRTEDDRADIRSNPELGIVGTAEWPPIIDEPTWRAAVRVLCNPERRTPTRGIGRGLLTGVAVCGVCGLTVHRGGAVRPDYATYRCRSLKHVARRAEPVDEWVSELAIAALSKPSAARLWSGDSHAVELMAEADVLRRRLADLAQDYAVMTRDQFLAANEDVRKRLAEVEARLDKAAPAPGLAAVATAQDPRKAWEALTVAQRRHIIDTIMVVKLHSPGRGRRNFDPDTVEVTPK